MLVNIDGTLKGIAASVAGKCGCNTYLSDQLSYLFPDDFRKQQMIDLTNTTYNLKLTVNEMMQHNTLQEFSQYVGILLLNN